MSYRYGPKISEHEHVPFEHGPEVCDVCGELAEYHQSTNPKTTPLTNGDTALWMTLIRLGGIDSYYGGMNEAGTIDLREHFGIIPLHERSNYSASFNAALERREQAIREYPEKVCEIDLIKTFPPEMSTVAEFAGTFTEADQVAAVQGYLYCKCGDYTQTEVVSKDLTLSQIMWHAVHYDDPDYQERLTPKEHS